MDKFFPEQYRKRGNYRYERSDSKYESVRRQCLRRDNYKCQMCGSKKRLQVHHIIRYADSISLRTEVSNLIVLCYKDHKKVTGNEKHYAEHFKEIVKRNENLRGH